jgi:phosphatidylethanolamine/phosphatidyl-N-methylethanolamine N-methyltransferase
LCRYLQARFSGLHVIQGNALQFGEWREIAGLGPLGAVVSGLPMRAIPHQAALRCYADAFRLMRDEGVIIQYTYGLRPPVDPSGAASLEAISLGREWRNFPPIGIWCYRRSM